MSSLTSDLLINPQDLFDITQNNFNSTTQLGARATTGDGRNFRYVLAGATALVPGTLQQSSAEVTAIENVALAAAAVGDKSITTTTTVTLTANQLAGGYVMVSVTPGQGYQYKIASHAAATAAAVTLYLEDPIIVALTTSSRVDLIASPYTGVIINPATASGMPVGVAVAATPAAYYGWVQTGGPATVLADGAVAVGTQVVASNATAGAVEALTGVQAIIGTAITGISTTEYGAINLTMN